MPTEELESPNAEPRFREQAAEIRYEKWKHWHVNWTAVWVGALAAFSVVLLFGLVGTAVGAHLLGPDHRVVDMKKLGLSTVVFSICGAFFAFVVGGWVAGKIAGILHAEPGMLYGAIVWLLTIPIIVVTAGLGASTLMGGWYGGLAGSPHSAAAETTPFVRPDLLLPNPTPEEITTYRAQQAEYNRSVKQWHEDTPKVTRNSALGAVTALLLGLIGSVLGGWMAAGEPMSLTHHRTRKPQYHSGLNESP
jgi:hypothetical protein